MASGDSLLAFHPYNNQPPATNYATLDTRNSVPVLDFDAATAEDAVFSGILPRNYAGGGVTVTLHWMATSATSGDTIWTTAWERMNTDEDADSFATGVDSAASTANGTSGIKTAVSIAHTNGAQIDSPVAGDPFRLKVTRKAADAGDTMTGDAELMMVEVRET